jgi:hypothetical protein
MVSLGNNDVQPWFKPLDVDYTKGYPARASKPL